MISLLQEMFAFSFMTRAFIVGVLVALCAALLGVSLVLKRFSMIGDGLSHVGFGALAVASAFHAAPLAIALPIVVAAAFLLLRIGDNGKIRGDAAIALLSTGSLAFGVMVVSMTTGMNTDVCNYLFGSILGVNQNEVAITVGLAIAVILVFVLCYPRIFAITFDETFAAATGTNTKLYNGLVALLTAFTIVLGMRTMGTLLITSLIVFPALTAMRLCKTFFSVTLTAAVISVVCFFGGLVISYLYATPTGASVAMLNIGMFAVFSAIEWLLGKRGTA